MSPEVLAKAFEPFFTTKAVGKGSGLGLAQVFGFAKQSGGGVSIDTAENAGTTLRVYLPSVARTAVPVISASDMPGRADADDKDRTILLVDDDPDVRSVTAMMLVSLGYSVVEADSGDEATLLDPDYNQIDFQNPSRRRVSFDLPSPALRAQMNQAASLIGGQFGFARVDFLIGDDEKVYLSEITFTPGNGLTYWPDDLDLDLGNLWALDV
jgi:hypothetical protein